MQLKDFKIFELSGKEETIFLSLAFSETEHLIALTGMPTYKIQVWYWRTHDMLISQDTEVITDKQKITCSSSLPLTVSQFAYKSGKMVVWEVHGTQKFCKLIKRVIQLDFDKAQGPFQDVYSIDGNIQIVNKSGDIYYIIPSSGSVNLIAKWNGSQGDFSSCIAFIRNGILISGPDGTLTYFKRQKYVWNKVFQAPAPDPFIMLKGYHDNESVIGTTIDGGIYKIVLTDNDKISFTNVKTYDQGYTFFALIHPNTNHVLVANVLNNIYVKSITTGERVAEVFIENSTIIQTNPRFPFIGVGDSNGDVTIISLFDPENPKVLTEFQLTRCAIVDMKFSDFGHFLVAVDEDFNFFVLRTFPGEKMTILHHFKEKMKIQDFFMVETRTQIDIFFLRINDDDSNTLLKVIFQLDDTESETRKEFELPDRFVSIFGITNSTEKFYGIRQGSKFVEVFQIESDLIELCEVIETPHKLRHIQGCSDGNHLVTWSVDGIAAVYDVNNKHELLVAFVANNRNNFGTKIAHCDAKCEMMLTLDQKGNLFSSKLNISKPSKEQENFIEVMEKAQTEIAEMFSKATSGGFPGLSMEHFGKKFTDLKSEYMFQMEARDSEQTRKLLFNQLANLRSQVKKMLDENENISEDEMLEVQDFNLDLQTTAQKEMEAQEERNNEEKKMMDYIDAQTAMNNWFIEKCWNPMEVKGVKLRGMFVSLFVDNFPLLPEKNNNQMERIKMQRAIENSVAREDAFLPWQPISTL